MLVQTAKFYSSLLEKLKKLDPAKLRTPLKKWLGARPFYSIVAFLNCLEFFLFHDFSDANSEFWRFSDYYISLSLTCYSLIGSQRLQSVFVKYDKKTLAIPYDTDWPSRVIRSLMVTRALSFQCVTCLSEVGVWGWCGRKQVHSRCSGKEVSSLGVMFSISNRDADVKERAVILGHASYWLSGEYLSLIVAAPHRDWRLSNLLWTSDFISASLPFLGEILFTEVASIRERKSQIMRAI